MKQFWLGLGLMGAILICGLFLEKNLENRHRPQVRDLERAAICAQKEDWSQAEALIKRAQRSWEQGRNLTAAAVHHDAVDKIDICFAELSAYEEGREKAEFCAGCTGLALQLENLSRVHGLSWGNLR